MAMAALRGAGVSFASTRNPTVPSPCPVAPDVSTSHAASLCADHVHSRDVVMRSVPLPPSAETVAASACALMAQRVGVGAVDVCDEEPHAADSASAASATAS